MSLGDSRFLGIMNHFYNQTSKGGEWHSTKFSETTSTAANDELWYKQFNTS